MTVVRINAITVPADSGDELARRFAARAGAVWMQSPAFGHGHRSAAERAGGPAQPSVGISSELWSYEVAGGSRG
jgi:hypothetical protein